MSAFMCSDSHIAELAHYLARHNPNHNLKEVFNTLRDENERSVTHRYPGDSDMVSHIGRDFDVTMYVPQVTDHTAVLKLSGLSVV